MVKIGNRKVIFSELLLCPQNENMELEINVPGDAEPWPLRVAIVETNDAANENNKNTSMNIVEDEDGVALVTFTNWNKPLGSSLRQPLAIATSDEGNAITILADVAKLTSLYRAHVQIMIEEGDND